jgi:hypothetical protein
MLVEVQNALEIVLQGKAEPVPAWEGVVTFEFGGFSFLMREDYTTVSGPPSADGVSDQRL